MYRRGASRSGSGDPSGVGLDFVPSSATPLADTRIAFFGHSYVRYLRAADTGRQYYQGADGIKSYEIQYFSVSGAKVGSLRNSAEWYNLGLYRPHVTFLFIGGNDIRYDIVPKELAREITDLALEIEQITNGSCKIVNIEKRLKTRGISADDFNKVANAVNKNLRQKIPEAKPRFFATPIIVKDLGGDGVHPHIEAVKDIHGRVVRLIIKLLERGEGMFTLRRPENSR